MSVPYKQALDKALEIQNEKHRSGLMELKDVYSDIDNAIGSIKSDTRNSHSRNLEQRCPWRKC